jgi:acyl-coenzyme A thioesterase PaaI-like protein
VSGTSAFDEAMFNSMPPTDRGGAAFARYLDALRRVGDATIDADPEEEGWDAAAARLEEVATRLEAARAEPEVGPVGRRPDLPGRGHPLLPAFRIVEVGATSAVAIGEFSPFYTGWRAVHGGMLSVVLDEIFGLTVAIASGAVTRTAFLDVDFRSLTPVGEELRIETEIERQEGRKWFMRGRVLAGERLCADAECLAVVLRDQSAAVDARRIPTTSV